MDSLILLEEARHLLRPKRLPRELPCVVHWNIGEVRRHMEAELGSAVAVGDRSRGRVELGEFGGEGGWFGG